MARFNEQTEVLSRPLDIVQISLACVLGYADFRLCRLRLAQGLSQPRRL